MTLADLDARVPVLWERILGRMLDKAELDRHAAGLSAEYIPYYLELKNPPFISMGIVFERGFKGYFAKAGIDSDPRIAADIFLQEHNYCPVYEDAIELFNRLGNRYRIVISSDADLSMVKGLLGKIPHEQAFISEALGAYKSDVDNAFFHEVIRKTGVLASEILHIGDGRADIIGAKSAGIDVYYVDRKGKGVPSGVPFKPDYSGHDLRGLYAFLGI